MKRIFGLLLVMFAAMVPSVAHAGFWAVATLDPLPPLRPGEQVVVGFTLLQHGVTPVEIADWPGAEVGLSVRTGGAARFVPAVADGAAGHFVASVDVPPEATTVSLKVEMPGGLIVEEQWLDVPVAATAAGSTGEETAAAWLPLWTLPLAAVAAACAAVVVVDVRSGRRNRVAEQDRAMA